MARSLQIPIQMAGGRVMPGSAVKQSSMPPTPQSPIPPSGGFTPDVRSSEVVSPIPIAPRLRPQQTKPPSQQQQQQNQQRFDVDLNFGGTPHSDTPHTQPGQPSGLPQFVGQDPNSGFITSPRRNRPGNLPASLTPRRGPRESPAAQRNREAVAALAIAHDADRYGSRQPPRSRDPENKLLYGTAYLNNGRITYETTNRMQNWLATLDSVPKLRHLRGDSNGTNGIDEGNKENEPAMMSGQQQQQRDTRDVDEMDIDKLNVNDDNEPVKVAAGTKRSAVDISYGDRPPAAKRSRLSTFRETISRAGQRGHSSNVVERQCEPPSTFPDGAAAAVAEASAAARKASGKHRPPKLLSKFNFFSSRRDQDRYGAMPPTSMPVMDRRIKVCVLGDSCAGKTTLINRLISGQYVKATPSLATEYQAFSMMADDGELVVVELWDFPGRIAAERANHQLMSTFFQAAVICYSIEDEKNLKAITKTWKPKLESSLIDCPLFVLGLKKEMRPTFPSLGLSFLPENEPAATAVGQHIAQKIGAAGFGECSARTNENVQEVFRGVVDFVVARTKHYTEQRERHSRRNHLLSKASKGKGAVRDAGKVMVDAIFGFSAEIQKKF